jgi:hypothetical protein
MPACRGLKPPVPAPFLCDKEGAAMNHWISAAVPAAIAMAIMTYGFYLAG